MSLRSPLSRVLGLGAAKEGPEHWWMQRVTAVALVALTLWFVAALLGFGDWSYDVMRGWLGRPVNATLSILLVVALVYHSQLGVQVVLEDYVAQPGLKVAVLMGNTFVHLGLGAAGVFAVLYIGLGSAA